MGADAQSNIPFRLAGAEPIAVKEAADQAPFATPYNEGGNAFQFQQLPENPFTGTRQSVNPSIEQFMGYLDQVLQDQGYGTGVTPNLPYNGAQGIASMPDGGVLFDDGMIRYEDNTEREYTGQQAQPIASMVDGSIKYSDGSFRKPAAPAPYGIASMQGNQVLRNDGSRVFGPYQTETGANMPGGLRGLISGVFGQDRPITQDYGNVNPIEPTPGNINYGTDLRTRDLAGPQRELKLPVGATVVKVLKDDGTRFGDKSGHMGYGNSLLLRLPSGEMLRFSHLSKVLDVQEGDTIDPGETFGIPGTTGNTYGEHLDLEYYDANGQVSNPAQFSGFTNPQSILPNQPQPGSMVPGQGQNSSQMPNQPGSQLPQPGQTQAPQPEQSYTPSPMYQAAQGAAQSVGQAGQQAAQATAGAINKVNPTGNFDLGITESLQGNPEEAARKQRETIANVGTSVRAPELQTNELSESQGTNPFRQLAGNLVDAASTPLKKVGLPDFGFSEAIAGGKTVNTGLNLAPTAGASDGGPTPNMSKAPTTKDYADVLAKNFQAAGQSVGNTINNAGEQIKTTFSNAVQKPIEGINKLKTEFQTGVADVGEGLSDVLSKIGPKKKIGEESGGDQNILGAPKDSPEKNDIRDPFFKLGGAETYGKYINENMIGDGGLSLDLFKGDFYKDADAIANILGSTHLLKPAQDKYKANEAAKYPKMGHMGYEEGYDRGAIDEHNKQIDQYNAAIDNYINSIDLSTKTPTYGEAPRSSQSIIPGTNFSPNVSMSQQRAQANQGLFSNAFTLGAPDLNRTPVSGASASLSPTALNRQSLNVNSPNMPRKAPQAPGLSISQARDIGSRSGMGVPAIKTPNRTIQAPQGSNLRVDSGGEIQAVKNASVKLPRTGAIVDFSTPTKTVSAQLASPKASTPSKSGGTNIFSKAVNAVKKLFGR